MCYPSPKAVMKSFYKIIFAWFLVLLLSYRDHFFVIILSTLYYDKVITEQNWWRQSFRNWTQAYYGLSRTTHSDLSFNFLHLISTFADTYQMWRVQKISLSFLSNFSIHQYLSRSDHFYEKWSWFYQSKKIWIFGDECLVCQDHFRHDQHSSTINE